MINGKKLIPVIKLSDPDTLQPWAFIDCPLVVVKMQDILSNDGTKFNDSFKEIKSSGGIHKFLGCKCGVILSTIMKDEMLDGCTVDKYVEVIHALQPEFYLTPDGMTYEGKLAAAEIQMKKMLAQTREIMRRCHGSTPLGLVKGSNINQVDYYMDSLREMGIGNMVVHVGDFFYRSKGKEAHRAYLYAKAARAKCKKLFVYGIGSGYIRQFFFADGFINQSYFMNAFNKKYFEEGRWRRRRSAPNKELMEKNLIGLNKYVENLENEQGGLEKWAAESQETKYPRHIEAPRAAKRLERMLENP